MDKEFSKLFGARVRYFRNLARLSQEQLAGKLDCEPTTIQYIETGKNNISFTKISKLAEALGIEAYQLFLFDRTVPEADIVQEIVKIAETMTTAQLGILHKFILSASNMNK